MKNGTVFRCPVCGETLSGERTLICPQGHAYDRAKSGYVNLLMAQQAGQHGDDRPMVRARTAFLNGGYYAPLADGIFSVADALLHAGDTVLDSGCGEGWYTEYLLSRLNREDRKISVCGIDISKDALIAAAKRLPSADFAVASAFHLPLADGAVRLIWNIFAPEATEEFFRVLAPGGYLIKVLPLADHLMELKRAVYADTYENPSDTPEYPGFSFLSRTEIHDRILLPDRQTVENLFTMTPYCHKTSDEDKAKLSKLDSLETVISFGIYLYRKEP